MEEAIIIKRHLQTVVEGGVPRFLMNAIPELQLTALMPHQALNPKPSTTSKLDLTLNPIYSSVHVVFRDPYPYVTL